jgi:RNase H-fold protein (predicted Holliday junction resolvase)
MTNMMKRKQLKKIRRTKLITKKDNIEKMMVGMKRKPDMDIRERREEQIRRDLVKGFRSRSEGYNDEQESTT